MSNIVIYYKDTKAFRHAMPSAMRIKTNECFITQCKKM